MTSLTKGAVPRTLAVASATAALPTASVPICGGTSLVPAVFGGLVRVPTVGNDTPSKWGCNLLPSNVAGLVPVERLQIDLNVCYGAPYGINLTVEGEYGPATTNAVRTVQRSEGVTQDGDYGPQTIRGTLIGGSFLYQVSGSPGECDSIAATRP